MKINDLEKWFDNQELPNTFILNDFTTITDVKKFVNTHINFIKNYPDNKTFKPYYDRLIDFKKAIS